MPSLNRDHRRLLENTVARARGIAEEGARKVLSDQYAVHHHEPWPHMTPDEKELRNQLRAHGRQLGDRRDDRRDTQDIDHLVQACAFEHWHRMLFARFLAENDLLLDPDHGMAMRLEEVQELAREQNREWIEIAAELAQRMLLAVFRPDDPVLRVSLPRETRQELEEKLESLPAAVFQADDSLGWVYQFWQRDEKDRVYKSEVKIGADELPAVTQLFTEDYMVLFLLENTLGAWWTTKRRTEGKEAALRGYEWTYLRLNDDGSPAAGAFDGWPRTARELRVLDPSMGSGHFLVFALPILARMRMEEEGCSLQEALVAALNENLFGLEIDARCAQIAAFNLALAAWRLAGEHFPLRQMNLACSGLGIHAPEADWVKLAGEDGLAREEMRRLYSLFRDAPVLGSLVDPLRLRATVFTAGAERVLPLIEEALRQEQSDETRELAIAAQGVLSAFRILAKRFALVATNVPYLGRGKQDPVLAEYCSEFHADAKADLATSFVDRCLRFCSNGGSVALVSPQNWLFLSTYTSFRKRLFKECEWNFVVKLGPAAFQDMNWWAANTSLIMLTYRVPGEQWQIAGIDAGDNRDFTLKADLLGLRHVERIAQQAQLTHPDCRLLLSPLGQQRLLELYASALQGIATGDYSHFGRCFWEMPQKSADWEFQQSTVEATIPYGGREHLFMWQQGSGELSRADQARIQGLEAMGKWGVAISQMRALPATIYSGEHFDNNCSAVVSSDMAIATAIWSYAQSGELARAVRAIDQKSSVTNATLVKVPFDLEYWQRVAAEQYPDGLPKPHSDDPTQWLFCGHPSGSRRPLQVSAARLVGYRWPRQTGSSFRDCPALDPDGLESHADVDGIVPLNAIAGDASAADRLRELLAEAYSDEWSAAKLREMLGNWDSLEEWLRDGFFEEHCGIFHQRPFIWHIWDGRKDGFHALVNYHRLAAPHGEGRKTLEKLLYTYLGRWIERQQDEVKTGKEGADSRLTAALHLKGELEKILAGEQPYDVFVRWKPLDEQPVGWEPDINDGVRLNIRPWLATTLAPSTKPRKGACILRITPKINYGKDRGREPHRPKEDFPWFWSWDAQSDDFPGGKDFDGARWTDLHYSLDAKCSARERRKQTGTNA